MIDISNSQLLPGLLTMHRLLHQFPMIINVFFIFVLCQELNYEYSIEVPNYICDNEQKLKSETTTIRLLGKDAQKFKYSWTVNFKNITTCKQNQQRCTLMAWRSVRNLEKHLKNVCESQEKLNTININNTLLLSEIQYILNVTVINNGTKIDTKEFLLECSNTSNASIIQTQQQNLRESLTLFGSNLTYRDMMYVLNAEITNGDNNTSYYFKWEILDGGKNVVVNQPTKGSELQLQPHILKGEQYIIKCSLINAEQTVMVATATKNVRVLKRGLNLKLAVAKLSVGVNQRFKLSAYFEDTDRLNGTTNIEWECLDKEKNPCSNFRSVNSTTLESKFSAVGKYFITITIKKGVVIKNDSCEIDVVESGFSKIDIDDIDQPLDPSLEINVPVYISNLVAGCTLQWMCVRESNYSYVDLDEAPGRINIKTNVTLKEDEFLNEIDEFSNNTVDMEYNFKIPPSKNKWGGLQGNAWYLFRLNVTCPGNKEESKDIEEISEPLQNYVTLTADITLRTASPPALNALEVTPKEGIALKTLFYFDTNETSDKSDYPVLYKFGYYLDNQIIFVSKLLGVTNTKSVFPYIEKGVKTVLEGCSTHSLCAQKFGPIIRMDEPTFLDEKQFNLMPQLIELINREEYYKAFTFSLAIVQTYNNMKNKSAATSLQNFITNITIGEIQRLSQQGDDDDINWKGAANDLLKNVGILLNAFSNDEELLNNVVVLRNKLSNKKDFTELVESVDVNYRPRKLLTIDEPKNQRRKREVEKVTLDEVRSYFVISELIITTSNDKNKVAKERENLLKQLDKFMQQLCANLYEKSQTVNLEMKTLILSIEKINRNNFNRYLHILQDTNSWKINAKIKLGKCYGEIMSSTTRLCVGKAVLKNYLNKKGLVYMVKIYDADSNSRVDFREKSCESLLVLPLKDKKPEGSYTECEYWNKEWSSSYCKAVQVTATAIQCQCTDLGYFALEYNLAPLKMTSTSTTTTTTTERPVLSSKETFTTIVNEMKTTPERSVWSSTETSTTIDKIITTTPSTISTVTEQAATKQFILETSPYTIDNEVLTIGYVLNGTLQSNSSHADFEEGGNETIHYILIGFSLTGCAGLIYGIKRLLKSEEEVALEDFPEYALIHNPELLEDFPDT